MPLADPKNPGAAVDPAALERIVGDARVVLLGEATHGTSEFQTLKHRLIRHLVREKGFDTLAFEEVPANLTALNAYLQGGGGDLDRLMAESGMFLWWKTREVRDLFVWLRDHNAVNQNPVTLTGVDVAQGNTLGTVDAVLSYLNRVDPRGFATARTAYGCFRLDSRAASSYPTRPGAERSACRRGLEGVRVYLEQNRERLQAASSPEAYYSAWDAARDLLVSEALITLNRNGAAAGDPALLGQAFELREGVMGRRVLDLLARDPNRKVIVWAHNLHAGRIKDTVLPTVLMPIPFKASMGELVGRALGSGAVSIGFSFGQGGFNALNMSTQEIGAKVGSPSPQSYEALFERLGTGAFLLDLHRAEVSRVLSPPRPLRSAIGGGYDPKKPEQGYIKPSPPSLFDAVIHVRVTTPTSFLVDVPR